MTNNGPECFSSSSGRRKPNKDECMLLDDVAFLPCLFCPACTNTEAGNLIGQQITGETLVDQLCWRLASEDSDIK